MLTPVLLLFMGTMVLANIASSMWVKFKLLDAPAEDTVDLPLPAKQPLKDGRSASR